MLWLRADWRNLQKVKRLIVKLERGRATLSSVPKLHPGPDSHILASRSVL